MSADLLESRLEDKRERGLASAIRKSSQRMGALIEDVLDFARGRLGGGIPVRRTRVDDLQGVFSSVIAEIRRRSRMCRLSRTSRSRRTFIVIRRASGSCCPIWWATP